MRTRPARRSSPSCARSQNYEGAGLFSPGVSFTGFGTPAMFPKKSCQDFAQLKNGKFVTAKKNVCGNLISYP